MNNNKRVIDNESKIIIVGGGSRGLYFTKMLSKDMNKHIAAIVDTYKEGHQAINYRLLEFGIPGIPIYASLDKAIEEIPRSMSDIMFIMTPEWTHMEIFKKAVGAGFNIFLEKPIATIKEDLLEILKVSRNYEKVVQVGFVLRYSNFYRKIKDVVDTGVLGNIIVLQLNERLDLRHGGVFKRTWHRKKEYTGGIMNEKCSHDIDIICWLKEGQSNPKEVISYGGMHFGTSNKVTPQWCKECNYKNCPWRWKGLSSFKNINGSHYFDATSSGIGRCIFHSDSDVYDHQNVNIIFDDGSQAIFTLITMSGEPGRDITIHGTKGYLTGNLESGKIKISQYWEEKTEIIDLGETDSHGGGDGTVVSEFFTCIDAGKRPLSTIEDGARASLICFAADESIVEKRTITL